MFLKFLYLSCLLFSITEFSSQIFCGEPYEFVFLVQREVTYITENHAVKMLDKWMLNKEGYMLRQNFYMKINVHVCVYKTAKTCLYKSKVRTYLNSIAVNSLILIGNNLGFPIQVFWISRKLSEGNHHRNRCISFIYFVSIKNQPRLSCQNL